MRLRINGRERLVEVESDTSLLVALREDLGLTGTRYGCGHGVCGACFVLVDGIPTAACTTTVGEVTGKTIITIEGLAEGGQRHPVQQAFLDEDAMQCGYCTSGMIISGVSLLKRSPHPTEDDIRQALNPHLCRCGVYGRAVRAILKAAQ
jgi:aerobic-type carbon monoxide dehydrogenase small subunit (CoxS/CutS family)